MPRSVLRVVAVILALCAVGGFVLGLRGAPDRARLPGEAPGGGAALQASEARPLDDLVLTPSELPPQEEPKPEEKPEEKTEEAAAPVEKPPEPLVKPAPALKTPAAPPADEDRVGDLIDGLTPPPEQPPY